MSRRSRERPVKMPARALRTSPRSSRERRLTGAWDRLSRVYDRQLPLEHPALALAIGLARPASADTVLDAGTGTGAALRMLAERRPRPARAIGVDSSPAMLARVPRLPPGWRLVLADLTSLPLEDESVDLALAVYVLHVLAPMERTRALAELHRVLRRGARLVVVTPALPTALPPVLLAAARTLACALPRASGLRPLDPRHDLRAAGFVVDVAQRARGGYPSLCVAARRAAA